ncbi:PREDICTED: serine-rich and transmembrane domain-containing protein 1 isoform X1 [Hipposideros armiger]|uniref:Serine-rich and transmembrane domain-containing protein 1 isoform X1 n=1 Tax=Hipposideros armiger TaxID=186990 RepID=A0A8B7S5Y8_HIPAR|nr:PREDICTED: serine-rich and transmembrane domain-containing protein 1 isoform X1 [Hipposideros armiger]
MEWGGAATRLRAGLAVMHRARGLEWALRGTPTRCKRGRNLAESRCFRLQREIPEAPKKLHSPILPRYTQKLGAAHLPSPDGAPRANASSSPRIFQCWRKLLPRRSGAAVLAPGVRRSSGWGAAGSGPTSPPLVVRAGGAEGRRAVPRTRRPRAHSRRAGCSVCAPAARAPLPRAPHSCGRLRGLRSPRQGATAWSSERPGEVGASRPAASVDT